MGSASTAGAFSPQGCGGSGTSCSWTRNIFQLKTGNTGLCHSGPGSRYPQISDRTLVAEVIISCDDVFRAHQFQGPLPPSSPRSPPRHTAPRPSAKIQRRHEVCVLRMSLRYRRRLTHSPLAKRAAGQWESGGLNPSPPLPPPSGADVHYSSQNKASRRPGAPRWKKKKKISKKLACVRDVAGVGEARLSSSPGMYLDRHTDDLGWGGQSPAGE